MGVDPITLSWTQATAPTPLSWTKRSGADVILDEEYQAILDEDGHPITEE